MSLDLRQLIGKLGETPRRALEAASGLALSKTHDEVELEHWWVKLLETADSDLPQVLRHFDVDPDHFLAALRGELDTHRTGHRQKPQLTETIVDLAREAWVWCSINYGLPHVRSGGILIAALEDAELYRRLLTIFPEIARVNVETLKQDFVALVGGSIEDREARAARGTGAAPTHEAAPGAPSASPGLDQYTVDLTAEAEAGRIDPVLGREPEVRQIVDILTRRRQNNPILTGEAGVGKTAVVEGLALRVSQGDVPEPLRGVRLLTLDLGLLQAGAGVKGEFENRLKQVIDEVKRSPQPIILFIDEAHTMIGAGGHEGQNDAANLLKPALARGELRTIGATTWSEYKKYFEKDPALTRRFQPVKVEEPDEETAIRMMRGVADKFEAHHGVRILDEAIEDSVRLSARYVPARQLPDKSVSVLDTACARVGVGVGAVPGVIEDLRRRLDALDAERRRLDKEQELGEDHAARIDEIDQARGEARTRLDALESRWEAEKQAVDRIRDLRRQIVLPESEASATRDLDALRAELAQAREQLAKLQGEDPLVLIDVDGQAIAEVISSQTGIPVGRMLADEIHSVLGLQETLKRRVLGQDHGLEAIARRIHTARANLDNPNKPIGVFMLVGPSGVGKTETAMALAESLYGGERNAIVINMSEYQEAHTVSSLKGSPPGYVGYGEGGVLTEAVRRRPYSVVLLDEVEKAHPDVMELFFQVFDKGVLEDGEGREIDFKNTIILLTSNVGSDTIIGLSADPETRPEPEAMVEAIRPELLTAFPAALLGRLVAVPYFPVTGEVLASIVRLQVERIVRRVRENHGAEFVFGDDLIDVVVGRCDEVESGGRAVDNILTHSMLPQLSAEVLTRMAEGRSFSKVEVSPGDDGEFRFEIS